MQKKELNTNEAPETENETLLRLREAIDLRNSLERQLKAKFSEIENLRQCFKTTKQVVLARLANAFLKKNNVDRKKARKNKNLSMDADHGFLFEIDGMIRHVKIGMNRLSSERGLALEDQKSVERKFERLTARQELQQPLLDVGIKIIKRWLYEDRDDKDTEAIVEGNKAAHQGNVQAAVAMFALNHLNAEIHGHLFSSKFDRGIPEYFISGSRLQVELRSEPLRQILDMNATLVLDLPHISDLESQRMYRDYKELEERCKEILSVGRFQKTGMITEDTWEMLCKSPDVVEIIREMRKKVDRLHVAANNSRFMGPGRLTLRRL